MKKILVRNREVRSKREGKGEMENWDNEMLTIFSGIDACSPGEIEDCKECGFQTHEISFTGCFLSNSDIQYLAKEGALQQILILIISFNLHTSQGFMLILIL
jgi:hypothetical protein